MNVRRPSAARGAVVFCALALLASALPARAQTPPPDPPPVPNAAPSEIELNLINLPTTMSLKRHQSYFRLTHRFARDLRRGDFGELASDLFSLDQSAIIGLEYRFGITSHLQGGIHRSLISKTIQMFGKWDAVHQGARAPVSLTVTGTVEGLNNFHEKRQPGIAVTISRTYTHVLAVYATPAFVAGTQEPDLVAGHGHDAGAAGEHANHNDTWFMGVGTRARILPTAYVVVEWTPRLAGYDPNASQWGVAIEKRTGGHTLQVNFTNSFGTTPGQLARGGNSGQVYLGFNITRQF